LGDESEVWGCYEELLKKAKRLHEEHGLFIGDAHSKNLCIANVDGDAKILVVDGKVAGLTGDADAAWRRLQVKLRYEDDRDHHWFLNKYVAFIDSVWRKDS